MTVRFEDIFSVVCSKVSSGQANEFQKIFLLEDAKEARLVYDLLVAYSFEVKLYDDHGVSKLYLTLPPDDDATNEKFAAALAYAGTLKSIKSQLDGFCSRNAATSPGYTLSFANTADKGKQLLIHILPPHSQVRETPLPAAPVAAAPPVAAIAKASHHPHMHRPVFKKHRVVKEDSHLHSGPAIGKHAMIKERAKKPENEGIMNEIKHLITGHMAIGGTAALLLIIIGLIIFSFFIVSKGFLCPDLAVVKSHAWYCPHTDDNDNKPQP